MPIDKTPEQIIRGVIVACADCESCRYLMEDSCLFFPELYRLFDREMDNKEPASDLELRELANLCTLCDLCPCPNIREEIIRRVSVGRGGGCRGRRIRRRGTWGRGL